MRGVGGRESGGAVFVAFRVFYARWVQPVALSAAMRERGLIKGLDRFVLRVNPRSTCFVACSSTGNGCRGAQQPVNVRVDMYDARTYSWSGFALGMHDGRYIKSATTKLRWC